MGISDISRRQMFVRSAASAVAISLAMSINSVARKAQAKVDPKPDPKADNALLNALLAAEYDAIATYTAGAGIITGDTDTPKATRDTVIGVAVHFQSQHKEHAAALAKLITDNGGTPVEDSKEAKLPDSFPAATATTTDVIKLAADKEQAAAFTYASLMKQISTQTAAKLVASIGGVESQHFVVLHLIATGLISANEATGMTPELVVPAAFILDVGGAGTQSLENFPALDKLLTLDAP